MSLVFKTIQTEGIAELSYLLGDDDEGIGGIFDPRADVDVYVDMAREAGLGITHIFETHIQAHRVRGWRGGGGRGERLEARENKRWRPIHIRRSAGDGAAYSRPHARAHVLFAGRSGPSGGAGGGGG